MGKFICFFLVVQRPTKLSFLVITCCEEMVQDRGGVHLGLDLQGPSELKVHLCSTVSLVDAIGSETAQASTG